MTAKQEFECVDEESVRLHERKLVAGLLRSIHNDPVLYKSLFNLDIQRLLDGLATMIENREHHQDQVTM